MNCEICNQEFATLAALRAHLTRMHYVPSTEHRQFIPSLAAAEDKERAYQKGIKVDYPRLLFFTQDIPRGLDTSMDRQRITPEMKEKITTRDNGVCYICNAVNSPHIHHRIPNGEASEENLFTLCYHCHDIVHSLLFVDRKWKHRYTGAHPKSST